MWNGHRQSCREEGRCKPRSEPASLTPAFPFRWKTSLSKPDVSSRRNRAMYRLLLHISHPHFAGHYMDPPAQLLRQYSHTHTVISSVPVSSSLRASRAYTHHRSMPVVPSTLFEYCCWYQIVPDRSTCPHNLTD